MKTRSSHGRRAGAVGPGPEAWPPRNNESGHALFLVLVFSAIGLATLAGALSWCITNTTLNQRNNDYFRAVAAAEAATEKVISHLADDYQRDGDYGVSSHFSEYAAFVPISGESALFGNYQFSDAQGGVSRTYVANTSPVQFRVLTSQYRGLYGYASTYVIISNARQLGGRFNMTAGVRQDVDLATIPVFQFAIFYNGELEINPGPNMSVSGPVHCNTNIYLQPQASLSFQGDITSAGYIIQNKEPLDPTSRTPGTISFAGEHDNGVSTLTLPIGTNNSPSAVRQVVEIPPAGEDVASAMGQQRFYNKADLVILVSDSGVVAKSGLVNNGGTVIPASQYASFLRTDVSFYNKRETKTIRATEINVAQLKQWNQTNTVLRSVIPNGDIRLVYVDDMRTQNSGTEAGVRLVNGQTILPSGLTVATPNPLYVKGNYNAPAAALGTSDTSGTLPAALIADAITVLSGGWNDANAASDLGSRQAVATTVNAAFLAGNVPTTSASYSGGVENFPRFLEDWSGDTFTYNGSMVVLFDSQYATGLWRGTGSSIGIYNPPDRKWAFDQNFCNPTKLPPGTPQVRKLVRGQWAMVKPNTITVAN
jgi:hypothetical protein